MNRADLPPKPVLWCLVAMTALSLVPLGLVVRARYARITKPPIHIVPDMDIQEKWVTQGESPFFKDGRMMRLPVTGTVARGELHDTAFYTGKEDGEFVSDIPVPLTSKLLKRGQDRFVVFCSPCHGFDGRGKGMIAKRAVKLGEELWMAPTNLAGRTARKRKAGHLFNTTTNGIRLMPAHGPQIPPGDRWAIVAYMRALQKSQNVKLSELPEDKRAELK